MSERQLLVTMRDGMGARSLNEFIENLAARQDVVSAELKPLALVVKGREESLTIGYVHDRQREVIEKVIDFLCADGCMAGRDPIDTIRGLFPDLYVKAIHGSVEMGPVDTGVTRRDLDPSSSPALEFLKRKDES